MTCNGAGDCSCGSWSGRGGFHTAEREELQRLLRDKSFQFGEFTLSSGKESRYYFDGKQVTLHPRGAWLVARAILDKVKHYGVQAIGGPTIGADPMVGALAVLCAQENKALDFFLVRGEAKQHGKRRQIEGPPLSPGRRVAVIDDVLTTGGSIYRAVEAVEAAGGEVAVAVVLVDRLEGGTEMLVGKGIAVDPLFTIKDFGL